MPDPEAPSHLIQPDAVDSSGDTHTHGKKILFLVTEDWYFCSHRLPIARAARDAGMEVVVATRIQAHRKIIEQENFRVVPLRWRRRSRNPVREIQAFIRLLQIYREEKPDVVHHVAMKPVLYGSAAALITGVPRRINAIAGFGYVFTSPSPKARLLRPLFRSAFKRMMNRPGTCVIVQNPDDQNAVIRAGISTPDRIRLIRGSGVDVDRFVPGTEPGSTPTVTMVARMLWTKGVAEMVEAARLLRKRGVKGRVWLVGEPDPENPESVPESELRRWHEEGVVEWKGHVEDILTVWYKTHVAVLPSYREGLPKTMLEAAACGLPTVAADVPGCREIVHNEENGYLVPAGNAGALADAIEWLLADKSLRERMGIRSRELAVESFSERLIVEQTLSVYRSMLAPVGPAREGR
jgi:glycosyltransferase involved in cell wall biosynthesis